MSVTKSHLGELINDFGKNIVADYARTVNQYKSKSSKGKLIDDIVGTTRVRKDSLKNLLFNNFESLRFLSAVYEFEGDVGGLDYNDELSELEGVCETSFFGDTGKIVGFKKVKMDVYADYVPGETLVSEYDEDDLEEMTLYFPFIVEKRESHLLVTVGVLFSGRRFNSYDGTKYYIEEHDFRISPFADGIVVKLRSDFENFTIGDRVNFVAGVKSLVQQGKIDAVRVDCDDAVNDGVNSRKLHNRSSKTFVVRDWYNSHDFFTTSIIYATNWYYTDGDTSMRPEKYPRLHINCSDGIIKKGKLTKDSLSWYINELLQENS